MMEGLIRGIQPGIGITDYLLEASRLNCSPREIHYECTSHGERKRLLRNLPQAIYDGGKSIRINTSRGNLMGEPMTKCFLTLASMTAYFAALQGYRNISEAKAIVPEGKLMPTRGRSFACAGDDHIAVGNLEFVKTIPKLLQQMGYEISWEKYRISRKYCHYCQDFGIAPSSKLGIKVDTMKLRLVNQFQKQGGTQFDSADPLIGKMRELEKSMKYIEKPEIRDFINSVTPYMVRAGLPSYFEKKVYKNGLCFLPTQLGGLGIPSPLTEWTDSMHVLAYGSTIKKIEPFAEPTGKFRRIWERSIEKYSEVRNFSLINDHDGLDTQSAFELTKESLSVITEESGAPSNSRVLRTMHKERINIMEPQTLLGNKESPYAAMFRNQCISKVVNQKARAGPHLRIAMLKAKSLEHLHRPVIYSLDPSEKMGFWVERSALYLKLNIGFYVPSLFIEKDFFEGESGAYAPDITSELVE